METSLTSLKDQHDIESSDILLIIGVGSSHLRRLLGSWPRAANHILAGCHSHDLEAWQIDDIRLDVDRDHTGFCYGSTIQPAVENCHPTEAC